jgi:hypothetical protein
MLPSDQDSGSKQGLSTFFHKAPAGLTTICSKAGAPDHHRLTGGIMASGNVTPARPDGEPPNFVLDRRGVPVIRGIDHPDLVAAADKLSAARVARTPIVLRLVVDNTKASP